MSRPQNILISGSGIAGSVFASWLLRAYKDAKITIVERAPAPRLTGASVDIRNAAVDIIKWMGVEPAIRAQGTNEEGVSYVRADGRSIATFKATGRPDVQSLTSEYEIFRGALAKIFIEPIMGQVKIIYNDTVKHYEQIGDQVVVTFASHNQEAYDLLVAADGLGSKVRGMLLNASPHEQLHDEGVHVAYFTIKKDLLDGSRLAKWRNLTGGRCVFLRPDPDPAGSTRANFLNVTWKSDTAMKDRLNKALDGGNESYLQLMEELYRDGDWLTPKVLQGMRKSDDFYCSLFAQVRSPKLREGRVVLLGDAGYATPGFGTSLAIIGGYILAGELLTHSGDIGTALMRYEQLMQAFAGKSQNDDIAMQLLNPQTRWGITIRNCAIWFVTKAKLDQFAILAAAKFGILDKPFALPQYSWPVT